MTGPADPSSALPALSLAEAWELTRAISPRPVVRAADIDAYGYAGTTYTGQHRLAQDAPDGPWAVYLTDAHGRFRLLAFDLDRSRGDVEQDAAALTDLLTAAGLPHLQARSGPSDGRHVWVGLAEPVEADTVADLGRLLRTQLPTLDLSPLSNPRTGCVRPPGAPHRDGGTSMVLAGQLQALTSPRGTAAAVQKLLHALQPRTAARRPAPGPNPAGAATTPATDATGHLCLPGPRRALPALSAVALHGGPTQAPDASHAHDTPSSRALSTSPSGDDASRTLWTALIGAAAAHWTHSDVARLLATAPGLEHVRSARTGTGARTPRAAAARDQLLARQWHRAVCWAAQHPHTGADDDPTFPARAAAAVADAEHTQSRADASGGRWTQPGGAADRRVLDALTALSLQALSTTVEADTRRLAMTCGIGRETARVALLRLAQDRWISQHSPGTGPHGASWTLPKALHPQVYNQSRSQVDPRPREGSPGPSQRTWWLGRLRARLAAAAHDVFTYPTGLGHQAGQVYARLREQDAAAASHDTPASRSGRLDPTARALSRLRFARLVRPVGSIWVASPGDGRDAAAHSLGSVGVLAARAARYTDEREAWAWWHDELAWRRRRRPHRLEGPGAGQQPLPLSLAGPPTASAEARSVLTARQRHGRHPTRGRGRADFRAALATVRAARSPSTSVSDSWAGLDATARSVYGTTGRHDTDAENG